MMLFLRGKLLAENSFVGKIILAENSFGQKKFFFSYRIPRPPIKNGVNTITLCIS